MDFKEADALLEQALGIYIADQIGKTSTVIELLKKIQDVENDTNNVEISAKHLLGVIYYGSNQIQNAEDILLSVPKSKIKPNTEMGVKYHLLLAEIYKQNRKYKEAIDAYSLIPEKFNDEYLQANVAIGQCYIFQRSYDKAITAWEKIPNTAGKYYSQAQFYIGNAYFEQSHKEEAETHWCKVDNCCKTSYTQASANLGLLNYGRNYLAEAYEFFKRVHQEFPPIYLQAQFYLGQIYKKQGDFEKAIERWKEALKVAHGDQTYSINILIADAHRKLENFDDSKKILEQIPENKGEYYLNVQLHLGYVYLDTSNLRKAIECFNKASAIPLSSQIFRRAKLSLCAAYGEFGNFKEAQNAYLEAKNAISDFSRDIDEIYKSQIYESMLKVKNKNIFKLYRTLSGLLNSLLVNQKEDNLVAHYTTPYVSYLMLTHHKKKREEPNNNQKNACLRLNPIHFMNDPTEGKLVNFLFGLDNHEYERKAQKLEAFISCVTLHQNSLNQFRLYGKENGVEASGVSLVLQRDKLFLNESTLNFIYNSEIEEKTLNINLALYRENVKKNELKLPLYRCIYFDPESGLIHIAHREEWTFCRQEKKAQGTGWNDYKRKIDEITDQVCSVVKQAKELIEAIEQSKKSDLSELLDEILLPLRYLIKHYAFKEEQECRVIYITSLDDTRVKLDEKLKRIYIDYANILPAMKKIYLPNGAFKHEGALRYLGETSPYGKFEVKRSKNPFQ